MMRSHLKTPENMTALGGKTPEAYLRAQPFMKRLGQVKDMMTVQQYRTLKGQALAGDLAGAEKGMLKVLGEK